MPSMSPDISDYSSLYQSGSILLSLLCDGMIMLHIIHEEVPITDFDDVEYRDLVKRMNDRSEEVGALSFPDGGDKDNVLIIFSGYLEIFYMMSVARSVKCQVIYFQDRFSQWYQGSTLLPDIEVIVRDHLPNLIGNRRPIFFGQSSGGYAALIAAAWSPRGWPSLAARRSWPTDRSRKRSAFHRPSRYRSRPMA